MPKKKDPDTTPGVKLLRMYRELAASGKKHYLSDLAIKLNCSPQTVMRMAGEIEYILGRHFRSEIDGNRRWYCLEPDKRRYFGLDSDEVRYLSLCRDLSVGVLPENVLEKIDEAIFSLAIKAVQKPIIGFMGKGRIDYKPHFGKIETLVSAVENGLICIVDYKASMKTATKQYHFAPKKILSMNNALYAIGACPSEDLSEYKHPVSLAVHRLENVALTDCKVEFDIPEVSVDMFGLPWHEPRRFRIHFKSGKAAEYVRERIWSDEQVITDIEDGGLILEITTQSEPELSSWVRSFGEEADVIESINIDKMSV